MPTCSSFESACYGCSHTIMKQWGEDILARSDLSSLCVTSKGRSYMWNVFPTERYDTLEYISLSYRKDIAAIVLSFFSNSLHTLAKLSVNPSLSSLRQTHLFLIRCWESIHWPSKDTLGFEGNCKYSRPLKSHPGTVPTSVITRVRRFSYPPPSPKDKKR